ncbi:sensor histidine kinase [Fructobacillus durionis]|uniref:histidine kinase n=1 Tax=Fructobacillus durionis TaxID=283737 RepID=A0A1I1H5L3_9LACO|nr:sensor histidine kinase [Fructobacillus durionis]SFC19005.1 hypothetical protein SAMN05660453_1270 [Fructobacillus durionis]
MIKSCLTFLKDYWLLYFLYACTILFLAWSTLLRSANAAIFSDVFWPFTYLLLIMTAILAIKWRRKRLAVRKLLKDPDLSTVEEHLGSSSQEKALQELLEQVLSQKTNLVEEKERESQKLKDYYALWAHQIKVPLSVLDLMNQTGTVDQAQTKEQLFLINQYLEMLLSFIRLQNFNGDLNLKKASARSLVMQVLKQYKFFFIQKDLSLKVSEGDFTLMTDSKWLRFALEQIIYNAIKYTKEGSIQVSCTDDQKIIIQDSGIGIDAADLPQVFNQGYTGFNGRVQDNASGLGLYLVKEILDKLGHKVSIESTIGVGTTVTIDCSQQTLS